MAKKSKLKSLSARRSPPRTRLGALRPPNTTPGSEGIPRTPLFVRAISNGVGTLKSVSLSDWWLTKKEEKKVLGVAGYEIKGGSEVRLFSSGPISKRHDSNTLETVDGIRVCISGFLNRSRTLQNGFSLEVCNRFLLGFPYNWEEEEEEVKKHFNIRFDGIPVSRYQDLLLSSWKNDILDDVVSSLRDVVCPRVVPFSHKLERRRVK